MSISQAAPPRGTDATRPWTSLYQAQRIDIALDAPGLRVLDATFEAGQQVPWHTHSNVVDHFWVLEGRLLVETTHPDARHELGVGGYCQVREGQPHTVTCIGDAPCRFVNLQGHGAYDFKPTGDEHAR